MDIKDISKYDGGWYEFTAKNNYSGELRFELYVKLFDNIILKGYEYCKGIMVDKKFDDFTGDFHSLEDKIAFVKQKKYVIDSELGAVSHSSLNDVLVPMYVVYDNYIITSIIAMFDDSTDDDPSELFSKKCYGCRYECSAQRDHMECPNGCLHDEKTCDDC